MGQTDSLWKAQQHLDLSLPFSEFAAQLQKQLERFKMGVLRIEKMNEDTGKIILTVSEDADKLLLPGNGTDRFPLESSAVYAVNSSISLRRE